MKPALASEPVTANRHLATGIHHGLVAFASVLALVISFPVGSDQPGVFSAGPLTLLDPTQTRAPDPRFADFGREPASTDARHVADWIADSRDAAGSSFFIIDKKSARLYAFDADARLLGSSAVLLGSARGDDPVPGIGSRPISEVRPHERTTHAGRFLAERGRNALGEDVIWVDYDAAVSMHRVRAANATERRLERLATPTADDNRISYGCINVPVAFYEAYIRPAFEKRRAIVYVLPEVKSAQHVFGSYDVATKQDAAPGR